MHCTVAELDQKLSLREFFEWQAFDELRHDERKREEG